MNRLREPFEECIPGGVIFTTDKKEFSLSLSLFFFGKGDADPVEAEHR